MCSIHYIANIRVHLAHKTQRPVIKPTQWYNEDTKIDWRSITSIHIYKSVGFWKLFCYFRFMATCRDSSGNSRPAHSRIFRILYDKAWWSTAAKLNCRTWPIWDYRRSVSFYGKIMFGFMWNFLVLLRRSQQVDNLRRPIDIRRIHHLLVRQR